MMERRISDVTKKSNKIKELPGVKIPEIKS